MASLRCREKVWSSGWAHVAPLTHGRRQPQVGHPPPNVSEGSVQRASVRTEGQTVLVCVHGNMSVNMRVCKGVCACEHASVPLCERACLGV